MKSHKGQSGTAPEFQEYPGNNTLIAAISFSETWRNYEGPNQACKKGGGNTAMLLAEKKNCSCLSASK